MSKLHLEILYPVDKPENYSIKTDIKRECLLEVLCNWVQDQIGKGANKTKAVDKDVYTIVISLDLSNDSFSWNSDTGNEGLTLGIVMDVIKRLTLKEKKEAKHV